MKLIKSSLLILLIAGFMCLLVVGCSSNEAAPNGGNNQQGTESQGSSQNTTDDQSSGDQNQAGPELSLEEIERDWQNSAHANTFLVDDEGQNNTCAQCHAPIEWMPSMDTIPETCFTCKFELEDPPPYIEEDAWQDIPCYVCHELDRHDEVQPEYTWLSIAAIDEYEEVSSTTELCQKCHVTADPVEGHMVVNVSGVHQDQTCTDCHDAHNTQADCTTCHNDLDFSASEIVGHDQDHAEIACFLCHDGGQPAADQDVDSGEWLLIDPDLDPTIRVASSHNIVLESNCARCHYEDNPWQLSVQP